MTVLSAMKGPPSTPQPIIGIGSSGLMPAAVALDVITAILVPYSMYATNAELNSVSEGSCMSSGMSSSKLT